MRCLFLFIDKNILFIDKNILSMYNYINFFIKSDNFKKLIIFLD